MICCYNSPKYKVRYNDDTYEELEDHAVRFWYYFLLFC